VCRDILYTLDRGHGLQAPCGGSGSDCGFSAGFAGLQIHDSRSRSRGNVGIPAGISKRCGKVGKPVLWLSMLSMPRHFHGYFLGEITLCSLQLRAIRALLQKRLESELRGNSRHYTRNLVLLLDGRRRVELRINVSSEATWINAAMSGLSMPAAAKPMPMVSTIKVP